MLLPYHQLANNSKVWIYQANRSFSIEEVNDINDSVEAFVEQWQSHQRVVQGYGAVYYRRFIVLMADETQVDVSGCSIDSSVKLIKELSAKYEIDFFDRMKICYKIQEQLVGSFNFQEIEHIIAEGKLKEDSIVFNNLVQTKEEFEQKWELKLKDSFFSKYLLVKNN